MPSLILRVISADRTLGPVRRRHGLTRLHSSLWNVGSGHAASRCSPDTVDPADPARSLVPLAKWGLPADSLRQTTSRVGPPASHRQLTLPRCQTVGPQGAHHAYRHPCHPITAWEPLAGPFHVPLPNGRPATARTCSGTRESWCAARSTRRSIGRIVPRCMQSGLRRRRPGSGSP